MGLETKATSSGKKFTKTDRLTHRNDFICLARFGKRHENRYLKAYVCHNQSSTSRLGITVSRKVGKATARNRIKRLIRECFRQNRQVIKDCWDISIIAKKGISDISNQLTVIFVKEILEKIEN